MDDLRELMKKRGWTQADVASRLGLSQSQVSRLLNGTSKSMRSQAAKRLADLMKESAEAAASNLAERVADAAKADRHFRALEEAAINLMHKNA